MGEVNDITQLMNTYRECTRNLWNTYFLGLITAENGWDIADEFDDICGSLFSSLVLNAINQESAKKAHLYDKEPQPLMFLQVVPSSESGVPIYVNRDTTCSGYWDFPYEIIKPSDAVLQFIDYFDFDHLGFRDFQYCRVRITASDHHTELIGRDALLNCNHVNVFYSELKTGCDSPNRRPID